MNIHNFTAVKIINGKFGLLVFIYSAFFSALRSCLNLNFRVFLGIEEKLIRLILISTLYFDFLRIFNKIFFYDLWKQLSSSFSVKLFEPFIAPLWLGFFHNSLLGFAKISMFNFYRQNFSSNSIFVFYGSTSCCCCLLLLLLLLLDTCNYLLLDTCKKSVSTQRKRSKLSWEYF